MRDLKTEELSQVYGAGGRGKRDCAPKKHKKKGGSSKSGGSKGGSGSRCRRGGSS